MKLSMPHIYIGPSLLFPHLKSATGFYHGPWKSANSVVSLKVHYFPLCIENISQYAATLFGQTTELNVQDADLFNIIV